ncbi:hypothetical protein FRC01_004820 [Tulasnella sp. 417]|nr:hypothetical protein FRC01_004820 [Tulasnella sp. 417]
MWSLVEIDQYTKPDSVRRLVDMAKSAKLDVRINGRMDVRIVGHTFTTKSVTFRAAVAAAAVKADQWKTLVFSGSEQYKCIPHVLSGLESVDIRYGIPRASAKMIPTISAPNLRDLVIRGNSQFAFTDCENLRNLEVVGLAECWGDNATVWAEKADHYFTWISGAFSALERLSFDFTNYGSPYRGPNEDISSLADGSAWPCFPRLKVLSFKSPTPHAIEYLFLKLRNCNPQVLEFTEIDGRQYPHPKPLHLPPSCRILRLDDRSLRTIRLFLSAFNDLSRVTVEVTDATHALGLTIASIGSPQFTSISDPWDDVRNEPGMKSIQRANQIREDWNFISSNAKVRWNFPRSPLEEGEEGIGLSKAVLYACQDLLSRQKGSYGPPNLGDAEQLAVILSILMDLGN